ncbi:MAG: NAD(P)-dependent dehydrogenase (short-subunit alcohol dehydrogenase family) [Myxococcota bacterium]|jgi:NAD(P)-dependent dehydrogenase (short-subunit alcohol dehydrogenase family)
MTQSRILITGSNAGFGRLAVLKMASEGHHVIATMRNLAKGDALLADCKASGVEIEVRQLDVCDPASVDSALSDAAGIDVLINNAGFEVQGAVEMIDDELMRRQLDTNVMGPLRTIRAVMPSWRKRGSGVIVNLSSVAGIVASPYGGAYTASKFALEGMSEALHYEVAPAGIRVHLIEPGRFSSTDFSNNIIHPEGWEGSEHQQRQQSFREALGSIDSDGPQDSQLVADAIARAASDPTTPFRTLVGDDALKIAGARAATKSFEDFEAAIRATINWHS